MSVAELIAQKVHELPPERQAEVLDFVEFLTVRDAAKEGWPESAFLAFAAVRRHSRITGRAMLFKVRSSSSVKQSSNVSRLKKQ